MIKGRSYVPAVVIATTLAVGMGAILLAQIVVHTELYFLNKWLLGLDYKDFYDASRRILAGQDPYTLRRYVTPPIPALLNIPLVSIPFEQARLVIMLLALLFVLFSYYLMQRRFDLQRKPDGPLVFVAGVVIIVLSYPVYFLFDRANIDGFVLLLMCAGLFFVDRRNVLAGLLFALAMSAKVYPVLLFIPIVAGRRWRLLAWTIAALALLVAVAPQLWASYLTNRILQRSSAFLLAENSSLANTFYFIGIQLSRLPIGALARDLHIQLRSFAFVFYAGLLLATALFDFLAARSASPKDYYARLAMYFPFMVAVPQLAYHYELVVLIALVPVVCYLWQEATTRVQRTLLGATIVGIILSQVQAVALKKLTGSVDPHYIPGFGLLIVILAITGLKFQNYVLRYPCLGRHRPQHRN